MKDLLSDTWVFQEISKEGEQKGEQKGEKRGRETELRDMLIRITTRCFPDLVSLAQQQAGQGKSLEQLRTMIDKLVTASTDQEARDVLMS